MRQFRSTVEIGLTKDDVIQAIELFVNQNMVALSNEKLFVNKLTINPNRKYIARFCVSNNEQGDD